MVEEVGLPQKLTKNLIISPLTTHLEDMVEVKKYPEKVVAGDYLVRVENIHSEYNVELGLRVGQMLGLHPWKPFTVINNTKLW